MRHSNRDARTGRWSIDTSNSPLSEAPTKFDRMTEFPVSAPSDVKDSPYELVASDRNVVSSPVAPKVADDLGVKGSPLRRRNPELIDATERARTTYYTSGRNVEQGSVGRTAARAGHGDMDPSLALFDPHGSHEGRYMGREDTERG